MANRQYELNKELAQMLKGGVIMDVTTPEQAKIAEAAGACAVMALERIPADIRAAGGVSRMSDPEDDQRYSGSSIYPCYGKVPYRTFCRSSASCKQSRLITLMRVKFFHLLMMYIISTRQSSKYHLSVVLRDLGEALRRINEGASMIRTKGEPGTGDVVQAVRHMQNDEQRDCTYLFYA